MIEITVNNKQDFIKLLDYAIDLVDELNKSLDTTAYLALILILLIIQIMKLNTHMGFTQNLLIY